MKVIEFIAPVEAMRGNLSGKQSLEYPNENNRAWDAPSDKREYARNYQPRFIGSKVSKTGKKYFSVRTKSAVLMSPAVREQQAVLSMSSVIANILMQDLAVVSALQALYMAYHKDNWTFKRWLMDNIKGGLRNKKTIVFPSQGQLAAIYVKNPYINTTQPSSAHDIDDQIPMELLVKFWTQLANSAITFEVEGLGKGIAHAGDKFSELVDSHYNNLELVNEDNFIKYGDLQLFAETLPVKGGDSPANDFTYRLGE